MPIDCVCTAHSLDLIVPLSPSSFLYHLSMLVPQWPHITAMPQGKAELEKWYAVVHKDFPPSYRYFNRTNEIKCSTHFSWTALHYLSYWEMLFKDFNSWHQFPEFKKSSVLMMLQKLTLSLEEPRFKQTSVAEQFSSLQYWQSSVST